MAEGNSLINLGEISKPATVLVEKISDAVGGLFRPYQIRRVSKAEADAEIIQAQAQIEITDLQRRALTRFVGEEAQKQKNMEDITQKAIPEVGESSNPENVEDDWLTNFFDKCRIVSDDQMQSLWAKVLAGEANAPGTYSKRAVNFLASLDKTDAELFTSLCSFGWMIGDLVPLIYDVRAPIYNKAGIDFTTLNHLDTIGLIKFEALGGYRRMKFLKQVVVFYYGTPIIIEFPNEQDNELQIGNVLLTQIGKQMALLCGSKPIEGFDDYIVQHWRDGGFVLSSIYPRIRIQP